MNRKAKVETAIGDLEIEDSRTSKRYNMSEPLSGDFAGAEVSVRNIGMGGVGVTTSSHIKIGNEATLIIDNKEFDEKIKFRCEVRRCKTSGEKAEDGGLLYHVGLKFTQPIDEIAGPLGRLIHFSGTEDSESFHRKIEVAAKRHLARAMADVTIPATIGSEEILRVERALMAISKGEADVDSLVQKAREEIDRKDLTAAESRDVLAIWAHLDFSISLKTISAIRAALESIRK